MDSTWFRRFAHDAPRDGGLPLFCFPHAGGSASAYVPLARRLAPEVDVLAVQYPGRQDRRREEPVTSLPRLAALVAEAALPQLTGPYAFFGHSMGASLAHETACALRDRGAPPPQRLFLSGRGAPGPRPAPSDVLDDDEAIVSMVGRLGGRGAEALADPELTAMALPALRADYRALGAYTPSSGAPLECPVSVLVGDADPVVSLESALGWRDSFAGEFRAHSFPGGHFYLDAEVDSVRDVVAADLLRPAAV